MDSISKTWERCKSYSGGAFGRNKSALMIRKSKSLSNETNITTPMIFHRNGHKPSNNHKRVAPQGCFSIYVGVHKERFAIKTEYVNHPLFKGLLEEAESIYGYSSEGPLVIPCEVEHFVKILMEVADCCHDVKKKMKKKRREDNAVL